MKWKQPSHITFAHLRLQFFIVLTLYNLFIALYQVVVRLVALWNPKAKEWVDGRRNWVQRLRDQVNHQNSWIWMHCASAGEFEQGKPVIEKIKTLYPDYKVLITFFSPSGYNVGRKYKHADHVCYLPIDTKWNASQFLGIVKPKMVVFVKYDYWYYHLHEINQQQIPLLLISAIFRSSQPFFHWYGGLHRKMLHFFSHLFIQDETSKELLQSIGVQHYTISGDTRFDRVAALAENNLPLDLIEEFVAQNKTLVAGSTWPDDEEMIKAVLDGENNLKLILAPHEINSSHINAIIKLFPQAVRYSDVTSRDLSTISVLIIDNIGMLSRLYKYAHITYIGGGFNKSGIHNTLEAAVWGKPILFGPNYHKFKEARDLIEKKAAFSVTNAAILKETLQHLLNDNERWKESAKAANTYVQEHKGATNTILNYIQEKRLLTN